MDRRKFLKSSVLASGAALCGRMVLAEAASSVPLRLTLDPGRRGNAIAANFTGLSYESAQLSQPDFFSASNTELVGLVRRLGKSGVMRIGGNTSEYCYWTPNAEVPAGGPQRNAPIGPDKGHHAPPKLQITTQAVRNLGTFIEATGWNLIYGLNMGTGTAEAAADEAAFVMRTVGDQLIAFQLCNEPDLFSHNGIRNPDYNYAQFAEEWRHFYQVIRQREPHAPFAGPDTAFNNEWLVPFAKQFRDDVAFLSQHYYAEGPPTDPSMTIERLLAPNPKLDAEFKGMRETKAESNLPFRLAETNSCYSGGKQGVSDTFASALWGADLMYQLAAAGGIGINIHGGGYGWYTPIAGTIPNGFVARPIYYGMLLFAEAGPGHLIGAALDNSAAAPLVTAYGLDNEGTVKAAVFNKHADRDVEITIAGAGQAAHALRLMAPRLDDTTDVTFGQNPVGDSGAWDPERREPLPMQNGSAAITLPAGSAALITFEA